MKVTSNINNDVNHILKILFWDQFHTLSAVLSSFSRCSPSTFLLAKSETYCSRFRPMSQQDTCWHVHSVTLRFCHWYCLRGWPSSRIWHTHKHTNTHRATVCPVSHSHQFWLLIYDNIMKENEPKINVFMTTKKYYMNHHVHAGNTKTKPCYVFLRNMN